MKLERTLTFSAMFISCLALIVSVWQVISIQEHNRLSLAPYLQVSPRLLGDSNTGLYLENAGNGSAFIKSATISVRGKKFDLTENQWPEFFEYIDVEPLCFKNTWFRFDAAILVSKELDLIRISDADFLLPQCQAEAVKFLTTDGVTLDIEYASIYKDRYQLSEEFSIKESDLRPFKYLSRILKGYNKQL